MINDLPEILQEGIILLGTFNSFSPRSFSFLNPALLDFPNKNVKMLQGSS
jgi:hypothetical protein